MKLVIAFASLEGQSRKIAHKIAERIESAGIDCELVNTMAQPEAGLSSSCNGLIAGGPLHVEHHPKELEEWLVRNRDQWLEIPCAFFSVSLSAASGRQKDRDAARKLMQQFIEKIEMQAQPAECFAGAMKYTGYGFFKRRLMRRIARKSGSRELDISRDYEYTDWEQVDSFTMAFIERVSEQT